METDRFQVLCLKGTVIGIEGTYTHTHIFVHIHGCMYWTKSNGWRK